MTADRCPRCRGPLILDFEDGAYCLLCGYRPPPAQLLGIPGEAIDAKSELARWYEAQASKQRRAEPRHHNKSL